MQFYIVDENPEVNAKMLPDYAIKKVNIREGYQILSDIGHAVGVLWTNQNKEYNRYHPNTVQFYKSKEKFAWFIANYEACLEEYKQRFGKITVFHKNYCNMPFLPILNNIKDMTDTEFMRQYMRDRKRQFLTEEEYKRLL